MTIPRLHHYVPQFYLRRFAGADDKLWVWDKTTDRTFPTTPRAIAAETDFYWLHEFERMGLDPLTMERQLADLEGGVALVTAQWLKWAEHLPAGETIPIPQTNREIVARYIALQFVRTADRKDLLCALYEQEHPGVTLTEEERTALHTTILWDLETLAKIEQHVANAIWIFGRNETATPFWASDNPVAFKTGNNKMWLKAAFLSKGTYVVFPLSPTIILYCHERVYWEKIAALDGKVSPVEFTDEMVQHENAGQRVGWVERPAKPITPASRVNDGFRVAQPILRAQCGLRR